MQVNVTFRHMEPTPALKAYAQEKVDKVTKYLSRAVDAHIVLSVERHNHTADISITGEGLQLRGHEASGDMYGSIDAAMEKIIRQVKRYREKIKRHTPISNAEAKPLRMQVFALPEEAAAGPVEHEPHILETKTIETQRMSVDAAVMTMDLINDNVLVFTNARTGVLSILHRLPDGNFGLIETAR